MVGTCACVKIDERFLADKYNVVGFYPLSCTKKSTTYASEWSRFLRDFVSQLEKVDTHRVLLTPRHFAVLNELQNLSPQDAFLPKKQFERLCARHGVPAVGELDQDWLLDLMDKLGIIITFPGIPFLDAHLLNPRWLTYGIYTLLYSEQAKRQRGRLALGEVETILQSRKVTDPHGVPLSYSTDRCRFIVDAMVQFGLCYLLSPTSEVIIPALLPAKQPNLELNINDARAFYFNFEGFLPRHLISELIARRNQDIRGNNVWQNGVEFRSRTFDAVALVRVDYQARQLWIWVAGSLASRYFAVLYDEVQHMLERLPDLITESWVELPEQARLLGQGQRRPRYGITKPRARYDDLLSHETEGIKTFVSADGNFDVSEALGIVPIEIRKNDSTREPRTYWQKPRVKESSRQKAAPERRSPWITGSFYLVALVLVVILSSLAASMFGIITAVVILSVSLILVGVIGALQLRNDDRISERSFLSLMRTSYRQIANIKTSLLTDKNPTESVDETE